MHVNNLLQEIEKHRAERRNYEREESPFQDAADQSVCRLGSWLVA